MNVYIRKIFDHDVSHEVSVTQDIVNRFFDGLFSLTFYKKSDVDLKNPYTVTINDATDARFGGQFKSIYDNSARIDDLLVVVKLKKGVYTLEVVRKENPAYQLLNTFFVSSVDRHAVVYGTDEVQTHQPKDTKKITAAYRQYITAIKSKPFLLLAGISGTGKSRIVRELARACWEVGSKEYEDHKPSNYEMVQVKPNWHDSSELIGYVSRISDVPYFVAGPFLKFVAKAWENPETPYFLCLDEMNLAPVEQYFAEYLSVVETRKYDSKTDTVLTDPILESKEDWFRVLTAELTTDDELRQQFLNKGITIPQNLIVVGTVNMDETTFSFSRKVLDRAMTIEMNEVDLYGGLDKKHDTIGKLDGTHLIGRAVEGSDIYEANKEKCNIALKYLKALNDKLEGTPFKVAYRTRNEFLLYVVNNLPYSLDNPDAIVATALDEITCMKVLTRIEGDETKVSKKFLDSIKQVVLDEIYTGMTPEEATKESVSLKKIDEMIARLESGYTSFWS